MDVLDPGVPYPTDPNIEMLYDDLMGLKNDINVLESRMDQFTSLQEGSTTGDAELMDGRIGYDGKAYDNIGGAIRKQVSELKSDLAQLNEKQSVTISGKTNTLVTKDCFIVKGRKYNFTNNTTGNVNLFLYREDGTRSDPITVTVAYTFVADLDDYSKIGVYFTSDGACLLESDDSGIYAKIDETADKMESKLDTKANTSTVSDFRAEFEDFKNGNEKTTVNQGIEQGKATLSGTSILYEDSTKFCRTKIIGTEAKEYSIHIPSTLSAIYMHCKADGSNAVYETSMLWKNGNFTISTTSERPSFVLCYKAASGNLDIAPTDITSIITTKEKNKYYASKEDVGIVLKVEKDGSGDYTTLKGAVDFSNQHDNVTILVGEGTYDLIEEFGNDYFAQMVDSDGQQQGLQLGRGVKLIFSSNSKVLCNYNGTNDSVKKNFSPFNFMRGSNGFTLQNLTLECANVRYGIHDEGGNHLTPNPYTNIYKNCVMSIDNSNNSAFPSHKCIGGGLGLQGEIVIENCLFLDGWKTTVTTPLVTYHNAKNSGAKSRIVITGCYFDDYRTVALSWYGETTEITEGIISNCSMTHEPYTVAENEDLYNIKNIKIIKWNNDIRQVNQLP